MYFEVEPTQLIDERMVSCEKRNEGLSLDVWSETLEGWSLQRMGGRAVESETSRGLLRPHSVGRPWFKFRGEIRARCLMWCL